MISLILKDLDFLILINRIKQGISVSPIQVEHCVWPSPCRLFNAKVPVDTIRVREHQLFYSLIEQLEAHSYVNVLALLDL